MQTPILFIIFNRPEPTRRVFEAIRKARPAKLLVVADGPRATRPGDRAACQATRDIIEGVDWPCQVLKNYSEHNLGCKNRVSSGITWAFEQEEELIVLEDDCLPSESFFQFAEYCLKKYRSDPRVALIAGTNLVPKYVLPDDNTTYRFSRYAHIWGWASWRRTWDGYSVEISDLPSSIMEFKGKFPCSVSNHEYWFKIFSQVQKGKIDTWDYQLFYFFWKSRLLSISPNFNLVENIGFGADATHTIGERPFWIRPLTEMPLPIRDPSVICSWEKSDIWESKYLFSNPSFVKRLVGAVKRRFNAIF